MRSWLVDYYTLFCSLFENEKNRERGSNLQRQRLASPTAQVLLAQTTRPVPTLAFSHSQKVNKILLLFLERTVPLVALRFCSDDERSRK